jgi:DNA-binding NarL/FixJ family response regulator
VAVRVLIVDDVPEVRQIVRTTLRVHDGFDVAGEAANGTDAITLAARERPDVIVLDLGLPDLAGREVLSRLREASPASKVVVFTATDPADSAGIAEHVEGYALKDDDLAYLVELIRQVGGPGDLTAALQLPASSTSARQARAFTRETLDRWQLGDVCDDALLIVTELVTNAVTHAGSACELRLTTGPLALRIEVTDIGAGTPDPLPPSATRNHGRGLHMIDAVAAAWGVEPVPAGGKVVWAEIRRSAPPALAQN